MNKKQSPISEILLFTIGEIIVAALTIGVFFILSLADVTSFDGKVFLGATLGCAAIVINYTMLTVAVNRAVNDFLERRGSREMTDEEIAQFTKENSRSIQNAITFSMFIRTATLLAALLVAFLTGWFNPLATAIPMLAFRPIIAIIEVVRKKHDKAPNPEKFIKYNYDDENKDEKESD